MSVVLFGLSSAPATAGWGWGEYADFATSELVPTITEALLLVPRLSSGIADGTLPAPPESSVLVAGVQALKAIVQVLLETLALSPRMVSGGAETPPVVASAALTPQIDTGRDGTPAVESEKLSPRISSDAESGPTAAAQNLRPKVKKG